MLFNGALAIVLREYLKWENKQRDKKYGVSGRRDGRVMGREEEKGDIGGVGVGVGDENEGPRFRFIL